MDFLYFPLRHARYEGPFILGRTFLQATHIIVDYDHGYFNLSQASYGGTEQRIVAIGAPDPPKHALPYDPTPGLSTGEYIGIGIGAFLAMVGVVVGLCFLSWKNWWPVPKRSSRGTSGTSKHYEKPELNGEAVPWVEAMGNARIELEAGEKEKAELDTTDNERAVEAMEKERAGLETVEPSHELTGSYELTLMADLNSNQGTVTFRPADSDRSAVNSGQL